MQYQRFFINNQEVSYKEYKASFPYQHPKLPHTLFNQVGWNTFNYLEEIGMTTVKYEKIHPDAKTPERATKGSVGYDLFAAEDVEIRPGETKVIKTGLRFELSEDQFIFITSKSGLAAKQNIFVLNSPGLIDSDYRGEIGVILHHVHHWNSQINLIISTLLRYSIKNILDSEDWINRRFPVNSYKISKGAKIAQAIFFPDQNVELVEGKVDTNTERGDGGFGSTGK